MLRFATALALVHLAAAVPGARVPPKGFNTFDRYGDINASALVALGEQMAAQLLPLGYDTLVLDGGWSETLLANGTRVQHLDGLGRPVPSPAKFPEGMRPVADALHALGLRLGLWIIRGVHGAAERAALPIPSCADAAAASVDQIVDTHCAVEAAKNCTCLWDAPWAAVNASAPCAQAYYDGLAELLVGTYGADFVKIDCVFGEPEYTDDIALFARAIDAASGGAARVSLSPGGEAHPDRGAAVAARGWATMYRVVTDFHGTWYGWGGLQQMAFIAGNFSAARLAGANGTWPDLDMLPPPDGARDRPDAPTDKERLMYSLYALARSPRMYAGTLPADAGSLGLLAHPTLEALHARGDAAAPYAYAGNCSCEGDATGSCTIPRDAFPPCVARWSAAVDGARVVAWLNIGENASAPDALALADAGVPAGAAVAVTDVWANQTLGVVANGSFAVPSIPPHGVRMYTLTPV